MEYNGEHLFPGQLGHFIAVLSLVASLVAAISFFKSFRSVLPPEKLSWLKLAKAAFLINTVCVISMFAILWFLMFNHYHEYYYAWNHSSRSLQPKYLLASFWEGQEGAFLLWSFWNCVLGWLIIWREKTWRAPILTIISFAQFCIATMLLGIYFFGLKIGSNPFILFREQMPGIPIFSNPDYLTLPKIFEGNDLNSLLQNYWMVIHPPVLFLGFASTVIPFGFAFGGLMSKEHSWTKAALPWASFSAAVLGTGIMMGAAWAYESLSFGGYWAWDPVENASLVPWLVMVAGLHTNLVYKSTGYSLKSTYLFYILSFSLVLYSSFLTRSGILGDTSVHAFTGADMTGQLVSFFLIFFLPALALYIARSKTIPTIKKEENTYSREFWMFIGSLVLFLSAIVIIAKTSLPVYNKVFGKNIAPPADVEFSYNQVQVFIAILIGIFTAFAQYLRYKDTPRSIFFGKILAPTIAALIISVLISMFGNINYEKNGAGFMVAIHAAVFAAVYAVIANAAFVGLVLRGKIKAAGPSVAHVGFGMVLLGILISSSKKQVLSINTTGIAVFEKTADQDPAENLTLFKNVKTDMGKYDVTYIRDSVNGVDRKKYAELRFNSKDNKEEFSLYPDWLANNKGQEGFSANPDKKHYWNRDIFAYVTSWRPGTASDTGSFKKIEMKPGDTTFYSNGMLVLERTTVNEQDIKHTIFPGETSLTLDITVISKDGRHYKINPAIALKDNSLRNLPDTLIAQSLIVRFNRLVDEKSGKMEVGVKEDTSMADLMTLKVYEFPFINVLWLGIVTMVIGFIMSLWQRVKQNRRSIIAPKASL